MTPPEKVLGLPNLKNVVPEFPLAKLMPSLLVGPSVISAEIAPGEFDPLSVTSELPLLVMVVPATAVMPVKAALKPLRSKPAVPLSASAPLFVKVEALPLRSVPEGPSATGGE